MTHRRRSPCCEDEARRYLDARGAAPQGTLDWKRLAKAMTAIGLAVNPDRFFAGEYGAAHALAAEYDRLVAALEPAEDESTDWHHHIQSVPGNWR